MCVSVTLLRRCGGEWEKYGRTVLGNFSMNFDSGQNHWCIVVRTQSAEIDYIRQNNRYIYISYHRWRTDITHSLRRRQMYTLRNVPVVFGRPPEIGSAGTFAIRVSSYGNVRARTAREVAIQYLTDCDKWHAKGDNKTTHAIR